jgi:hypothetical protein
VTTEISCPLVHLKGDLNIRDKNQLVKLERVEGIEPSYSAWKGIGNLNDLKRYSEK